VQLVPVIDAVAKDELFPTLQPPRIRSNQFFSYSAGIQTGRELLNDWLPFIVAAWGAGICFLSARLIVDWRLIRRIRTDAKEIQGVVWSERCARLCQRLGVRAPVSFLVSARARVPFAVGWIKPAVLLPSSALTGLSVQELDAILLHELAHIRR